MKPDIDYTLYLVTDRDLMSTPTLEEAVKYALDGGCTMVQLREKTASSLEFYQMALRIKKITDERNIPMIINDRVDIALAVDAAGVHIGQNDLPAGIVRRIIGTDKILGVSAVTLEEAQQAQKDGADYLGIGAVFPTGTKTDARYVTLSELKKICETVSIPAVAIGGVGVANAAQLAGTGVQGLAVVSAILAAKDITAAAGDIKRRWLEAGKI